MHAAGPAKGQKRRRRAVQCRRCGCCEAQRASELRRKPATAALRTQRKRGTLKAGAVGCVWGLCPSRPNVVCMGLGVQAISICLLTQ